MKRSDKFSKRSIYSLIVIAIIILSAVVVNSVWSYGDHSQYHLSSNILVSVNGDNYDLQEAFDNNLIPLSAQNCAIPGVCSQICVGGQCFNDWSNFVECDCLDSDSDGHYAETCTNIGCTTLPKDDCDNNDAHVYPGSQWTYYGSGLKDVNCDESYDFVWTNDYYTASSTWIYSPLNVYVYSDTNTCMTNPNGNYCFYNYFSSSYSNIGSDRCDYSISNPYSCSFPFGDCAVPNPPTGLVDTTLRQRCQ